MSTLFCAHLALNVRDMRAMVLMMKQEHQLRMRQTAVFEQCCKQHALIVDEDSRVVRRENAQAREHKLRCRCPSTST
jgi:hypothetical protein